MSIKNTETEVLLFVRKIFGKSIQKNNLINYGEYKISDLDAETFMEEFFNKFLIEYSSFKFDKYFDYDLLKNKNKISLSISHLIEVAKQKKWNDPH